MNNSVFPKVNSSFYYGWAFLILFSLSSCTSFKQPSFLKIENLDVLKADAQLITITSAVHFNNPNKGSMSLKEMKIEMLANGNALGTFLQDKESRIEGMSDFSVPFTISFSPKQLGQNLLQTALTMLGEQKLKVKFRGYAKIGGKKRGFKIPLIYTQTLKFN